MDTESKRIANQAAATKRTATSLRTLAESREIDAADRGVFLTAARIVETMAGRASTAARKMKREEDAFQRKLAAAKKEAAKLLRALPAATTLDQLALAYLDGYWGDYLADCISGLHGSDLARALQMKLERVAEDEATSIAYKMARSGQPASAYQAELLERFSRARAHPKVADLAARFDAAMAKEKAA